VRKAINLVNRLFGRNLTFDPLPVRVNIGQYVDAEPLVIDGFDVSFSKETFVSKTGRHIPITCSVQIKLSFWLRPSPKLGFMSILGEEMYGESFNFKVSQEIPPTGKEVAEQQKNKIESNLVPTQPASTSSTTGTGESSAVNTGTLDLGNLNVRNQ